ncbi:MAG TPA: hypothetical protein PKL30_22750 [Leptospiraceae bacterium]|nr:hypothetical protein [Leptospiraceae bacterium]HNA09490.1 hypothetical protein [Leptospiraceae bacterium]HNF57431.1 hypothetical protein [Leptospiraceae bacterium]HNH03038.1 hypothetical protein [Leptospiraceae bacterium]HNH57842.1 hypothetical protein [Leptospiraceae bacterium]
MSIQKEKEHLVMGKQRLTALGYNCEIGANDIFVYLPEGTYDNIRAIEQDLKETAGCSVWVIGV